MLLNTPVSYYYCESELKNGDLQSQKRLKIKV